MLGINDQYIESSVSFDSLLLLPFPNLPGPNFHLEGEPSSLSSGPGGGEKSSLSGPNRAQRLRFEIFTFLVAATMQPNVAASHSSFSRNHKL